MKELRQEGKMGQIPDYSPTMKPEFPFFLMAYSRDWLRSRIASGTLAEGKLADVHSPLAT